MKIFKRYYAIIALVAPFLLAACADNDVYNPDKVRPVPPVENPLGEDFVAPTCFDWSMITTVKLNIEKSKMSSTECTTIWQKFSLLIR